MLNSGKNAGRWQIVPVARICTLVDLIRKYKHERAVPVDKLERMVLHFGELVAKSIADAGLDAPTEAKLLDDIERRWRSIRL